jgi:hypothetical protein
VSDERTDDAMAGLFAIVVWFVIFVIPFIRIF